jgi:plasmid replication initiation protein
MMEKPIKNKKPIILKTPQSIVHIKHTISLRQYKYWVLLLRFYREFFELGEEPDKKGFYSVPIAKISDYMGYEPMKTELKADFGALRREPIIINFLDKDGKKAVHEMGFISEWKITSKTIAFRIPSFLEEVMRGDNEATRIFQLLNWNIFNSFNGKYEAIIYKLCKDYIGIRRTPYMTIVDYREYIGLKENEYIQFFELNRWTITSPIKAINKNEMSDITVSVEYKRTGRKVDGLYFKATEKKQTSLPFPEFEPNKAFAFAKIAISIQDQNKYLETMSPEEIEATIQRANEYAENLKAKGQKAHMGGIYQRAFSERWGVQYLAQHQAEQADIKNKVAAKKQQDTRERDEKQKAEQAILEKKARYQQAFDDFLLLPVEQQAAIKTDFMKIADGFTLKKIKELQAKGDDYFSSTLVIQNFKSFLINSNLV